MKLSKFELFIWWTNVVANLIGLVLFPMIGDIGWTIWTLIWFIISGTVLTRHYKG
jgi:hypothetical protein